MYIRDSWADQALSFYEPVKTYINCDLVVLFLCEAWKTIDTLEIALNKWYIGLESSFYMGMLKTQVF